MCCSTSGCSRWSPSDTTTSGGPRQSAGARAETQGAAPPGADVAEVTSLKALAPLTAEHDATGFDCVDLHLNDRLRPRALKNESRFSRTYVVAEENRIVAYYCISAGAEERAAAPGKLRRNAPDAIPVSVIGRLAVDRAYAGQGLGTDLLADAPPPHRPRLPNHRHRRRPSPRQRRNRQTLLPPPRRIHRIPGGSRTLFLPMETVVEGMG